MKRDSNVIRVNFGGTSVDQGSPSRESSQDSTELMEIMTTAINHMTRLSLERGVGRKNEVHYKQWVTSLQRSTIQELASIIMSLDIDTVQKKPTYSAALFDVFAQKSRDFRDSISKDKE